VSDARELLDKLLREVYEPHAARADGDGPMEYDELLNEPSIHTCREVARFLAQPVSVEIDPYDMRILVRALYTSGLTDDMNPVARRAAALRLRGSLRWQRDALAAIEEKQ